MEGSAKMITEATARLLASYYPATLIRDRWKAKEGRARLKGACHALAVAGVTEGLTGDETYLAVKRGMEQERLASWEARQYANWGKTSAKAVLRSILEAQMAKSMKGGE
jgi:hypothetical protein